MRRTLVASCLRGALPPVDLRAVCLVRAMVGVEVEGGGRWWESGTRVVVGRGERPSRDGGVSKAEQRASEAACTFEATSRTSLSLVLVVRRK